MASKRLCSESVNSQLQEAILEMCSWFVDGRPDTFQNVRGRPSPTSANSRVHRYSRLLPFDGIVLFHHLLEQVVVRHSASLEATETIPGFS